MKFVVNSRRKDVFLMLPAEKRTELLQGMIAHVEKVIKAGGVLANYEHLDLQGGVIILEVKSDRSDMEVAKSVLANPMSPFMDSDIMPVIDWDIAMKAISEASRR